MEKRTGISTILLRVAVAAGFLSAVASRLGFWGSHSSGWTNYLRYVQQVNSFAPKGLVPVIAVTSTILESGFAWLLLAGYKIKLAAVGSALLTLLFALAMTVSFGLKEPLDYSVFAFSAAAYMLSTLEDFPCSFDKLIQNKNKRA